MLCCLKETQAVLKKQLEEAHLARASGVVPQLPTTLQASCGKADPGKCEGENGILVLENRGKKHWVG